MLNRFEQNYEQEEMEITVLMMSGCKGAGIIGDWLYPSVTFVASIDNETKELVKKEGRIEWIIKNEPNRKGFGYDFKQYGTYRLLVRKAKPRKLESYQSEIMNNRYMLVKILEENVQNEKLQELKEYLEKPVIINTKYGDFELEREYGWFSGDMVIDGLEVDVSLNVDENSDSSATKALDVFLKIAEHFHKFDEKNKDFAAENLVELANDWLDDDNSEDKPEEITKDMFIESIKISQMTVSSDGSLTVYYHDGDLFWGHVISIEIDENGTYTDATIAG